MKTLSVGTVLTPVFENVISQWNINKMVLLKQKPNKLIESIVVQIQNIKVTN